MLTTVLFLIILVDYCSGKHPVNYGTIGAYEVFSFGNDDVFVVVQIAIHILEYLASRHNGRAATESGNQR